jgi:hypothetical protein
MVLETLANRFETYSPQLVLQTLKVSGCGNHFYLHSAQIRVDKSRSTAQDYGYGTPRCTFGGATWFLVLQGVN